jgi:hypothetical protein
MVVSQIIKKPERVCAGCGHTESQHGATGTKPCLAMVGDVLVRDFCPCDQFREQLSKAA